MVLPVPDCFSFMLRRNSPDASRRNATRSRWLGSILACTLKTKPVTSSSRRLDVAADRGLRAGAGRILRQRAQQLAPRRNSSAPSRNRPATDGLRDRWRDRMRGRPSRASSHPRPACLSTPGPSSAAMALWPMRVVARRRRRTRRCKDRSTPLKFSPMPAGHTMGAVSIWSWSEISSSSSKGSRASRSILLMKVMMGMSRRRQTSNSLRVWVSMPLAASITITARIGGGQGAVGVFGKILMARRVQQVEHRVLDTRRSSPREVTEMPRSCSIFIQSDLARRASPRALTRPAAWIAPPSSSRCSVSVVLPASGWEMIAKVRRRRACAAEAMSPLR